MPHTLLLADDSLTIQRVVELTFADEDVRVVAVSDGDQAIASLDRQPPDIVLADVGMPGRNGYEVASYVKSQPRLAHIPVLLLTGAFEPVDRVKAEQAGCDGVLAKPFEPRVVIGLVNELLAGVRGGSAPPDRSARPAAVLQTPDTPAASVKDDAAAARRSLVHYFDELDAALAKLPGARPHAASSRDELPAASPAANDKRPPPADAFAALLAAAPDTPPSSGAAASQSFPAISDEMVERVARRVLEKLSDPAVRQRVADLVSTIAERLVRDEIERIRGAVR